MTQFKCQSCQKNVFPSKTLRAYYCCQPFRLQKLLCKNCKQYKKQCNQCFKKCAAYEISLDQVEQQIKKNKVLSSKTQQKKNQLVQKILPSKCCLCLRTFKTPQPILIHHDKCSKYMCYPCVYRDLKSQKQKLNRQSKKGKQQQRLILSCCNNYGESTKFYELILKQYKCIFCGIDIGDKQQKIIYKIQNQFQFCESCFQKQHDNKEKCKSIEYVFNQIYKVIPTECLYCEKNIVLSKNSNQLMMLITLKRKLCLQCYKIHGKNNKNTIDLLKNYQVQNNLIEFCSNLKEANKYQCCQTACRKKMIVFHKQKNQNLLLVELNLVQWRNNKVYCGICLYFKYESKRKHIIYKILRKQVTQFQIQCLQAERISYQNYFNNKCMICLTQPSEKNRHRLLIDSNNNKMNPYSTYTKQQQKPLDQNSYRLSCQYCQKCLFLLQLEKLEDNQLIKIRQQIFNLDPQLDSVIKQIKNKKKQYLLKQYYPLKFWNINQYKQFWPITQKISEKKKQSIVNKQYLSLSNKGYLQSLNQRQQKNQDKMKQQQTYRSQQNDNNSSYDFREFNNKSNQNKVKTTNKLEQPDIDQNNTYIIEKEQSINASKITNYSKGKQYRTNHHYKTKQQIISKSNSYIDTDQVNNQSSQQQGQLKQQKYKYEQPDIFITPLKTFQEQQSYEITNGQQCMKSIKQYITNKQTVNNIVNNMPYQSLINSFNNNNKNFKNYNPSSKQASNNNKQPSMPSSKQLTNNNNNNNKCKVKSCGSSIPILNLGMMCDNCYISYLMGQLNLEKQIDQHIYNQKINQSKQLTQQLLSNNKQKQHIVKCSN